jgi:hypothetical protein
MAELKTKATTASVSQFINGITDDQRRKDCKTLIAMMTKATKARPKMWGSAIVGFGDYRYRYASGREGDWFLAGFSPRKSALSLYLMGGKKKELLDKLGMHSRGIGCLYLKNLDDVHKPTLQKLIDFSVKDLKRMVKEKQRGQKT